MRRHSSGQRVGVLYQDDASGRAGLAGLRGQVGVVTAQGYRPGDTTLERQIRAIKHSGAKVLVNFTLPAYTAMEVLALLHANYGPQLVVWSGGIDSITVARLLNTYSAGAVHGYGLIDGVISSPPVAVAASKA